jgi:acetate kinase
MGVKIDIDANDGARSAETIISLPDSTVKVALIPTNEELVIARDTMHIVTELEN